MKKLELRVEELEERIAPSFVFAEGSTPAEAGANPVGGQGNLEASFGPNSTVHPTLDAWIAHNGPSPLDNGGNA